MSRDWLLFSKYFIVTGKGVSRTSPLNAFDKALMDAGIAQCNLVCVSSIIPKNAREIEPVEIPAGNITFVVMAKENGSEGELISAGVGVAICKEHGLVAEACGKTSEEDLKRELEKKLKEMIDVRKFNIQKVKYRTVSLRVPKRKYGSVIAAVVFVP